MRHVWKSLVLLTAFILDSTLGSYIGIFDFSPGFLLVSVIAMAMAGGLAEAGIYGGVAGFLWDIAWGRTFGFYTLLYMYAAICARGFLEMVYKNKPIITAGVTFAAALFCVLFGYGLRFVIWGRGDFVYDVFRTILPTAVYTAVVQLILFRPITAISRPKQERGRRL